MASAQPAVIREKPPQVWEHWEPKPNPVPCDFELECQRLHLTGETMLQLASGSDVAHLALRWWAGKHCYDKYVPTELLDAWGIVVDIDLEMPR